MGTGPKVTPDKESIWCRPATEVLENKPLIIITIKHDWAKFSSIHRSGTMMRQIEGLGESCPAEEHNND